MTLRLPDHWVWDFWLVADGDDVHAFYLYAPRSLGDPDRRHRNARVGHAVSRDLRSWTVLGEALGPGAPGAPDSGATWTGSVIRHDGRWLMFYTGTRAEEDFKVQRVLLATSDDLTTWTKTDLVIEADPARYELVGHGDECHWRDPWAFVTPDGAVHLYITARAGDGPADGRGVIGHAWSRDLVTWEVGPPVNRPGAFRQLEVPQLIHVDGSWFLLFCAAPADHSARRRAEPDFVAEGGTHYLMGPGPLGPWADVPGPFLAGDAAWTTHAGRMIERPDGWHFLAWRQVDEAGRFAGELTDPVPVRVDDGGRLVVEGVAMLGIGAKLEESA